MSDFRPIMLNLPTYLKSDVINGRSPFEIWSKIFGHLDFKMQNLATLVCKTWLEMIRNDFVFSGELSLNSITKMEASEINSIISKWNTLKVLRALNSWHPERIPQWHYSRFGVFLFKIARHVKTVQIEFFVIEIIISAHISTLKKVLPKCEN